MPPPDDKSTDVLTGFYEADAKYVVAPVPTSLEDQPDRVADFITEHAKPDLSARRAERLARLAIYYDTGSVVRVFAEMLNKRELASQDYSRSAQAVAAVAWIGSAAEWKTAQTYYQRMLHRAKPLAHRQAMLNACDALGPDEGTDEDEIPEAA